MTTDHTSFLRPPAARPDAVAASSEPAPRAARAASLGGSENPGFVATLAGAPQPTAERERPAAVAASVRFPPAVPVPAPVVAVPAPVVAARAAGAAWPVR